MNVGATLIDEEIVTQGNLITSRCHDDLRRTFTTWVTVASGNEVLAMRLTRDTIPGVGQRYINEFSPIIVSTVKGGTSLRVDFPSFGGLKSGCRQT